MLMKCEFAGGDERIFEENNFERRNHANRRHTFVCVILTNRKTNRFVRS